MRNQRKMKNQSRRGNQMTLRAILQAALQRMGEETIKGIKRMTSKVKRSGFRRSELKKERI